MTPGFFIIQNKEDRARAVSFVSSIRAQPVMQVEVKEYKPNRSQAQNRLMWMWYGIIARDLGNTPEELHEQMKSRVLGFVEVEVPEKLKGFMGHVRRMAIPRSTTKLGTQEMTSFLEAVERLAGELGITLPHPDDYQYAMYGQRVV